jgi:hypothetical protein
LASDRDRTHPFDADLSSAGEAHALRIRQVLTLIGEDEALLGLPQLESGGPQHFLPLRHVRVHLVVAAAVHVGVRTGIRESLTGDRNAGVGEAVIPAHVEQLTGAVTEPRSRHQLAGGSDFATGFDGVLDDAGCIRIGGLGDDGEQTKQLLGSKRTPGTVTKPGGP